MFINGFSTLTGRDLGLDLFKSDTLSLMQQLAGIISSGGDNYRLAGWCLVGAVEFHYRNPYYLLYQLRGTGIDPNAQPDRKREMNARSAESMQTFYLCPNNVDVLEDYYYIGVSGGCYYTTASGSASGALFQYSASFDNGGVYRNGYQCFLYTWLWLR